MSKYGLLDPGTCLPVLEAICAAYDIENALEFGAGIWSTFCLTRNCKNVISIENHEGWVEQCRKDYSHKDNLEIVHWPKPMNDYLKTTDKTWDLIFIDGNDRVECLNDSIDRAPFIVCHDTHQANLGWGRGKVPRDRYDQLSYKGCLPYLTTVFYRKETNFKHVILNRDNFEHRNTWIDPNFWLDDVFRYKTTGEMVDKYMENYKG